MSTAAITSASLATAKRRGGHDKTLPSRRTTVTLSPESQEILERFKSATGASTSAAIDRIIRQSEPAPSRLIDYHGLLVLSLPPENPEDTVHFTIEDIKDAEDEMDREYVERILHRDRNTVSAGQRNGEDR